MPSCTGGTIGIPCINNVSVKVENHHSVWYVEDTQINEGPRIKSSLLRVPSVFYHGNVGRLDDRYSLKHVLLDKARSAVSPISISEALLKYSFVIETEDKPVTYGAYIDKKGYVKDYLLPDQTLVVSIDYADYRFKSSINVYSPMDEDGVKVVSHYDTRTRAFVPGSSKYNGIQVSRAESHGLRLVMFRLDDEGIIVINHKRYFPIMDPLSGRPFLVTKLANGHHRLGPPSVSFLVRFLENNVIRSVPIGTVPCSPTEAVASIIAKIAGVDINSLDCACISDAIANASISNSVNNDDTNDNNTNNNTNNKQRSSNGNEQSSTTLLNIHVRFSVQRSAKVTCTYEILSLYVAMTWT